MLDKMGKTDLGEAAKSLGIVFAIGIIVAVMGGMLTALVAEDETGYGGSGGEGEGEGEGGDGTARQFIGIMHREGKGLVGLVAFWAPIAGLLMILSAGIILLLGGQGGRGGGPRGALCGAVGARLAVAAAASAAAAGLLAARGAVGIETVAVAYAAALAADVAATALSPRYPSCETNLPLALGARLAGPRLGWALYGAAYAAACAAAMHALALDAHTMLAVLAPLHAAAAAANALGDRRLRMRAVHPAVPASAAGGGGARSARRA